MPFHDIQKQADPYPSHRPNTNCCKRYKTKARKETLKNDIRDWSWNLNIHDVIMGAVKVHDGYYTAIKHAIDIVNGASEVIKRCEQRHRKNKDSNREGGKVYFNGVYDTAKEMVLTLMGIKQ